MIVPPAGKAPAGGMFLPEFRREPYSGLNVTVRNKEKTIRRRENVVE